MFSLAILSMSCSGGQRFPAQLPRPAQADLDEATPLDYRELEIQEIQPTFVDTPIEVQGEVQQSAPLLESWLYEVMDSTGAVWIMSPDQPPEVGNQVSVGGILRYKPILIGGVDQGEYYLEERARDTL